MSLTAWNWFNVTNNQKNQTKLTKKPKPKKQKKQNQKKQRHQTKQSPGTFKIRLCWEWLVFWFFWCFWFWVFCFYRFWCSLNLNPETSTLGPWSMSTCTSVSNVAYLRYAERAKGSPFEPGGELTGKRNDHKGCEDDKMRIGNRGNMDLFSPRASLEKISKEEGEAPRATQQHPTCTERLQDTATQHAQGFFKEFILTGIHSPRLFTYSQLALQIMRCHTNWSRSS